MRCEYSPRPDTAALMYADKLSPELKRNRLVELQDVAVGLERLFRIVEALLREPDATGRNDA